MDVASSDEIVFEPIPPGLVSKHSEEDSDDELVFVDSSGQPAPAPAPKQKLKKRTKVITIPDTPPPRTKQLLDPSQRLRPFAEVQRELREKRKANEPLNARWPTREEHGDASTEDVPAHQVRQVERSSPNKGKGRAVEIPDPSIDPSHAYSASTMTATSPSHPTFPTLRRHNLDSLKGIVPSYPDHPLLRRLARPLEQDSPSRAAFLRPDALATADAVDTDLSKHAQQSWTTRFAPKAADEVLGVTSGSSARILKEWLNEHTLLADSETKKSKRRGPIVRNATKPKRRKRSSSSDLDDFLADSDEEESSDDEGSDDSDGGGSSFVPKSQAGRETFASRLTNLVLLRGPHGSGKTSTVHAVAAELGFDVFEVYPGMGKRTAKDIDKYVGDVAKNHMVRGGGAGGGSPTKTKDPFASFKKFTRPPSPVKLNSRDDVTEEQDGSRPRQSLILFDEVDILFTEEKDFWTGFANLVSLSRRPVVMTCSDASRIPFDNLALQPIRLDGFTSDTLEFAPPEPELAVSFLQLAALSQGHILSTRDLQHLYDEESRLTPTIIHQDGPSQPLPHPGSADVRAPRDLRRALTQLQFECQWAVGDPSGGVGWMDLDPERAGRTSWSVGTYSRPVTGRSTNGSSTRAPPSDLATALSKAESLSFSDAFVDRRTATHFQVEDLQHTPAGPNSLEGPVTLTTPLSLYLQLPLAGLEPEMTSAIASLVGWDEAAAETQAVALEESTLGYCSSVSDLLYPRLVDHPAPLLPDPAVIVEYLPLIQIITAADQLHAVAPAALGEPSRGVRRTRASAHLYEPKIRWREGDAERVLTLGFPADEA
ncbi:hypothetical protein RQP46_009377 [Phenoliferia psychrophenolica]